MPAANNGQKERAKSRRSSGIKKEGMDKKDQKRKKEPKVKLQKSKFVATVMPMPSSAAVNSNNGEITKTDKKKKSAAKPDLAQSEVLKENDSDNSNSSFKSALIKKRNRPQLGANAKKEDICTICEKVGEKLLFCTKGCNSYFHAECLKLEEIPSDVEKFVCDLCLVGKMQCFICKKDSDSTELGLGKLRRCTVQNCGRAYHATCLELKMLKFEHYTEFKNTNGNTQFRCPLHFCETCVVKSADSNKIKNLSRSRFFKCVRCPTSYHVGDDCIAAGSVRLAGFNIICPVHFSPKRSLPYHHPVHVSWCFICSQGGKLVCCASCPAAFHVECIELEKEPEGDFFCRDCQRGIRPLYGDLVWIKLGTYRWWPGEVIHPSDVPDNIMRLRHSIGEFVVQFLGSRDYFWLNRCRVFHYQDGDASGTTSRQCSKGISTIFKKALTEAEDLFAEKTELKMQMEVVKAAKNDKKPAPYKHIKVNRPVGKVQIYTADIKEIPRCACKISDSRPCSSESECINYMLLYECHPALCPAGDRCENQRFQKCLYPKSEVFKTSWGGWGLKAAEFVKKGNFVSEYVGELVDEEECKRRIEKSHEQDVTNYYMLTIDKDRIIDAGPKGNYSRFMNHSCDPNCETQKWTVNGDTRVGLFAKKDINPGEELTFNYNLDCLGNDKTTCKCGSKNCSGYIGERPKPQSQIGERKEPSKKKKRTKRSEILPQHDDLCFRCRNTGILLVCCDYKNCQKAYCLECLHITKPPYGKWECPWHHCDWCGRKAQYFCHFCPNSFCSSHIPNQLKQSVPSMFDCCLDHNPETAEFELMEAFNAAAELNAAVLVSDPVAEKVPALGVVSKLPDKTVTKKRKRESLPTMSKKNVTSAIQTETNLNGMKQDLIIADSSTINNTKKRKQTISKSSTKPGLQPTKYSADSKSLLAKSPKGKTPAVKRKRKSKDEEEEVIPVKRGYKPRGRKPMKPQIAKSSATTSVSDDLAKLQNMIREIKEGTHSFVALKPGRTDNGDAHAQSDAEVDSPSEADGCITLKTSNNNKVSYSEKSSANLREEDETMFNDKVVVERVVDNIADFAAKSVTLEEKLINKPEKKEIDNLCIDDKSVETQQKNYKSKNITDLKNPKTDSTPEENSFTSAKNQTLCNRTENVLNSVKSESNTVEEIKVDSAKVAGKNVHFVSIKNDDATKNKPKRTTENKKIDHDIKVGPVMKKLSTETSKLMQNVDKSVAANVENSVSESNNKNIEIVNSVLNNCLDVIGDNKA